MWMVDFLAMDETHFRDRGKSIYYASHFLTYMYFVYILARSIRYMFFLRREIEHQARISYLHTHIMAADRSSRSERITFMNAFQAYINILLMYAKVIFA